MQKCIELGMTEPFSPTKTGPFPYDQSRDQLYGTECEFVMETREKYGCQVKYLNTTKREPIDANRVATLWNEMTRGDLPPIAPPPPTNPNGAASKDAKDDIPFLD
jgi:hypothetical protein